MINKKIINSIIFFIIIAISLTSNAITVSVSSVCKNNIKSYNFDSFGYDPDFKIVFSSTTFDSDFTVKKISNYSSEPADFTIFNDSKILSTEEAISILILPNYSILDLQ